ncbi:MAG: 4-hydroxythreonine-4-phosphate dehydrogenase PdxA [Bacteroidetes bacterium GWF2_38_335]|nr:MAG: 4-hydroxythreonine-4-phosphate dehydrogenase PdxA [Bacteroidetes bacterium GWF2_38_335]OFY79720.1 MAG: 4-hydroxythreonine-4-phosphate dehydrogenase PdxA [Bacteroidetes bacterium RIFOXYA12_FULL_38_20]HBS87574.1 4-hydroxythreonine-4-phosphate dehydrogenase PdxA [Bacteroidales bacterium]
MDSKIKVGISHGDINGVGYEVIIKALMDTRLVEACTPIVYGSSKVAAYHRKALNINNFSFNNINKAEEANSKRANIINCIDENTRVELGKATDYAGESSFLALKAATKDLKDGKIDVLVTAPINKKNIQLPDFQFPGHSEYLASEFGVKEHLMLMVCDSLKVGIVTGHIPVSKISSEITVEKILTKLEIFNKSLKNDFAIRKPRIAVLGLNPHSGDEGVIGNEEIDVIIPAIEKAKSKDILAFGPFAADGFFGSSNFAKFDGILAMYHDQGLAPFKALVFDRGVNFTAGLPVVRTSPAHGTAYELAGKNEAGEESFRNAMYLAMDIFTNRKNHAELNKNPLPKHDTSNI